MSQTKFYTKTICRILKNGEIKEYITADKYQPTGEGRGRKQETISEEFADQILEHWRKNNYNLTKTSKELGISTFKLKKICTPEAKQLLQIFYT